MRVAITGAAGLLGYALARVFGERHEVVPLTRAEADITKEDELRLALGEIQPDVVVHSAAIADLDVCEINPELAHAVNAEGTRNIAEAARDVDAGVAYISTDAVFDGNKRTPYTEDEHPNPPTVYGLTKALGELFVRAVARHWIFRLSVLFGPGKTNFVERCLRKIAAGEECIVASDQVGSATYTLDAARVIREVVETQRFGIFHLANQGVCTRYELARRTAELARLDAGKVIGNALEEMKRTAKRLKYAVMQMDALSRGGVALPRHWEEALEEYVASIEGTGIPGGRQS